MPTARHAPSAATRAQWLVTAAGAYQAIYGFISKNGRWPRVNSDSDAAETVAIARQMFGGFGFNMFGDPLELDEELVGQVSHCL